MVYDFNKIEKKWQKKWQDKKIFEVKENKNKEKFYVLDMFPYPSGAGLHMGHAFVFSLGDIFARFKRLQNYNVLYPIGYDALGLPAENAAIKAKVFPKKYIDKAIKNFMKQQKAMGWSYDWTRLVRTDTPDYYKWDQWIFLKMLEQGIAYRKKAPVNWCPKCKTVLANEQVINGKCWRHEDTNVEIKQLEQWFFKITNYADELLDKLDDLDWPENAKKRQKNWIGKSYGTEINFKVEANGETRDWPIFTTRPDTIFGVTFMVISAQHPDLMEIVTKEQQKKVKEFLKKIKSVSEKDLANMNKEGIFTGSYAINPLTHNKLPIYAGNFVVADYGSGMVMAVPAHDQRDFEFAKKYELPIKIVIHPEEYDVSEDKMASAYTGEGVLVNSEEFTGLNDREAKESIVKLLEKQKLGKKVVQYKLRDWLISRQRYWGTPIPVVYCDKCGIVPIPEKELPVKLPEKVKFGKGNPLTTNKKWLETKCPKCGGFAKRETDTLDTFANSSWYYLRYTDPKNSKKIFDKKKADYWAPVDQYIGGPEHITMHLIYIRFYTKFLRDIGLLNFDEPALRLFNQGIVHSSEGEKMSKSKGNIIEPFDMIKKYGADTLRMALISLASPDKDSVWNQKIVLGSYKFLNKVYDFISNFKESKITERIESKLNKTIREVTNYIESFKHNLAIIQLRELFDLIFEQGADKKTIEKFLILLSVYCPYITEELWEKIGKKPFISLARWPKVEEEKINEFFEKQDLAISKLISDINNILKLVKGKEKIYVYVLPNDLEIYEFKLIRKKFGRYLEIFAVNDKGKYDPSNMSKKAKLGRPAIYLE